MKQNWKIKKIKILTLAVIKILANPKEYIMTLDVTL